MDEQNLILVVVDDVGKLGAATDQIRLSQLAFKNRILKMIAVPAHGLEDLAQAFVVADVVTDQVGLPHFNHCSENILRDERTDGRYRASISPEAETHLDQRRVPVLYP